jgi:GLPGLI family protein
MKNFSIFTLLVMMTVSAFGQAAEGVIRYEFRMDVHRSIPPEREEMKAMVPQFRTVNFDLFFNQQERLYKAVEEEAPMQGPGGGGGPRGGGFRMPRTEIYYSLENNERTVGTEFFSKNYLIIDTIALGPWKLGSEYMEIMGHRCQMAWYKDTVRGEEVTAWFTLGLQPFLGPDLYSTLPGTVLALDINNGERVWIARKIDMRPLVAAERRKPTRGEKITRGEYNKLMDEQRARMRQGGMVRF